MIKIVSVEPKEDFTLYVKFNNGKKGLFDVKPYFNRDFYRDLQNPSLFKSVKVSFDTVEWSNGVDFCPDSVYHNTRFVS